MENVQAHDKSITLIQFNQKQDKPDICRVTLLLSKNESLQFEFSARILRGCHDNMKLCGNYFSYEMTKSDIKWTDTTDTERSSQNEIPFQTCQKPTGEYMASNSPPPPPFVSFKNVTS